VPFSLKPAPALCAADVPRPAPPHPRPLPPASVAPQLAGLTPPQAKLLNTFSARAGAGAPGAAAVADETPGPDQTRGEE
jgi:hypothetical protein